MITSRRNFIGGLIAAPAVVKFASLMSVRGIIMDAAPVTFTAPTAFTVDAILTKSGVYTLEIPCTLMTGDSLTIEFKDEMLRLV